MNQYSLMRRSRYLDRLFVVRDWLIHRDSGPAGTAKLDIAERSVAVLACLLGDRLAIGRAVPIEPDELAAAETIDPEAVRILIRRRLLRRLPVEGTADFAFFLCWPQSLRRFHRTERRRP